MCQVATKPDTNFSKNNFASPAALKTRIQKIEDSRINFSRDREDILPFLIYFYNVDKLFACYNSEDIEFYSTDSTTTRILFVKTRYSSNIEREKRNREESRFDTYS